MWPAKVRHHEKSVNLRDKMKLAADQRQLEKLTKQWEKAYALWREASEKSQRAIGTYRWAVLDGSAKWNRVLVMRMREAIAFKKAATAHQMLADFIRTVPSTRDSE